MADGLRGRGGGVRLWRRAGRGGAGSPWRGWGILLLSGTSAALSLPPLPQERQPGSHRLSCTRGPGDGPGWTLWGRRRWRLGSRQGQAPHPGSACGSGLKGEAALLGGSTAWGRRAVDFGDHPPLSCPLGALPAGGALCQPLLLLIRNAGLGSAGTSPAGGQDRSPDPF